MAGDRRSGGADVVSARAYRYRPGEASALFSLPAQMQEREDGALEALIDVLGDRDAGHRAPRH